MTIHPRKEYCNQATAVASWQDSACTDHIHENKKLKRSTSSIKLKYRLWLVNLFQN